MPTGFARLASVDGSGREPLTHFVVLSTLPHWGILLRSTAPLAAVRQHLRRFLVVGTHDGGELYFRFYDPRVLSVFLPTCSAEQLDIFFGPIEAYWSLSDDATSYHEHRLANRRLITRHHVAKDGLPVDLWHVATSDRNR